MVATDAASLVEAAVRAACLARAPRRTVQAVAAAVVSVLAHPSPAANSAPRTARVERPSDPGASSGARRESSEEARREALAAKRRRKRQRKKAAKAAAVSTEPNVEANQAQQNAAEGAEDAVAESAGDVTPRRRATAVERDPTGEAPPSKRLCEDVLTAAVNVERRMSELSVATDDTGVTLWSRSDGGSFHPSARMQANGRTVALPLPRGPLDPGPTPK